VSWLQCSRSRGDTLTPLHVVGLVPFWTKRSPDYGSMLKTINCRDDSLYDDRGMWTSMKKKKRCIVVAQGFYEWLKKNNGKEKIPHFTKRKDGQLMCFAGLYDCVQFDGESRFRLQGMGPAWMALPVHSMVSPTTVSLQLSVVLRWHSHDNRRYITQEYCTGVLHKRTSLEFTQRCHVLLAWNTQH
jgi:hypothetical protein